MYKPVQKRVEGLGFRVEGLGFISTQSSRDGLTRLCIWVGGGGVGRAHFRVQSLDSRVLLGFGVSGLQFMVTLSPKP